MTTTRKALTRKRKIWTGIGAAALIGAGSIATPMAAGTPPREPSADAPGKPDHTHGSTGRQGGFMMLAAGEGGEGGEGAAAADLAPEIKFVRDLGLVRGHLLVGDELIKDGRWDDALPHFHHPIEELYTGIRPRLEAAGVRQFDAALKALAQAVQSKKLPAYQTALSALDKRLAEVGAKMDTALKSTPEATLRAVIAMLQSAASEYEEAIENGRIAKPVEYQDSRGFVWEAARMVDGVAEGLKAKDAGAIADIRAGLAELKAVWPSPLPPEKPVKDHGGVLADVSRIELAASRLVN